MMGLSQVGSSLDTLKIILELVQELSDDKKKRILLDEIAADIEKAKEIKLEAAKDLRAMEERKAEYEAIKAGAEEENKRLIELTKKNEAIEQSNKVRNSELSSREGAVTQRELDVTNREETLEKEITKFAATKEKEYANIEAKNKEADTLRRDYEDKFKALQSIVGG